jgi:hypothetical protein
VNQERPEDFFFCRIYKKMADFRLIIFSFILSVFSIASNSLLIKKRDHLTKSELNFSIISLVGSLVILLASMYFGFQSRSQVRGAVSNRMMDGAGRMVNASTYLRG